MKKLLLLLFFPIQLTAQRPSQVEISRWENQARQVTIIRDGYGVPHVYGKTDADAVFGLMYAQCEDDFNRVEMNYVDKLGRVSEIKGEKELTWDLMNRILFDSADAVYDYEHTAPWMKKLCNAFADAINYYLYKHPGVKPALITRFKPWYPFLWTDGSINAINMADITQKELASLYLDGNEFSSARSNPDPEILTGSNGFAFAPKITASGNAILYINPHVTFYFRPEVHMVSEEGLNAYGAVTWGQFFVYQGFNEHCGWMHTSSGVDAGDSYIETLEKKSNGWHYTYDNRQQPAIEKNLQLNYKTSNGLQSKNITALFTEHGPVMGKRNGQYLSLRADNRIADGLLQCWMRTKAKSFDEFKNVLGLLGNISNNTVYADAEGNIGYWHGNRIPRRDTQFDWSKPVDGAIPATDWKGYHFVNETIFSVNPPNGWLQNCNSTPFTVAGINSPKKENYPAYMAPDGENFRGINAVRVLSEGNKYTIETAIKAGYDKRLAAFEVLIPALIRDYDLYYIKGPAADVEILTRAIDTLRGWDFKCSENSIATTLAVFFGENISRLISQVKIPGNENADIVEKTIAFSTNSPEVLTINFMKTLLDLGKKYGKWQIPWGEINRFQRISPDIDHKFDDSKPSIPVGFVSSAWGMLPSYTSRTFEGTKKRYGVNGNSFICAVEFGKKIKAKSLLAGGQSGDPHSPHFFDQGELYSKGQFKEVLFYKEDVLKEAKRTYHPGE